MKCFESGLKNLMTSMRPNAQNEILQVMALKVLCGIAGDIFASKDVLHMNLRIHDAHGQC